MTVLKPIFVSGIGRSGTSAVLTSLATHRSINNNYRIGEAPFVSTFLAFLNDFENNSPEASYNLKNYRLDYKERCEHFANFITLNQCGVSFSGAEEHENKYWITKVSLTEASYRKAIEIFGEVRCVYVKRNGVEVINSAMQHPGFKNLSFEEHCDRWKANLEYCDYLKRYPLCSVVRHDRLVKDSEKCYRTIQKELGLPYDCTPANWISNNLFNSSFDNTSKGENTSNKFDTRLSEAWGSWDKGRRDVFISRCDATMCEHEFVRPYASMEPLSRLVHSNKDVLRNTQLRAEPELTESAYTDEIRKVTKNRIHENVFNYLCNISSKYNYLFVNNPKVASTSLLSKLQRLENVELAENMSNIHMRSESPMLRLSSLEKQRQSEYLFSAETYRFAFVRNPFERLLSAYLSKINKPLLGFMYDNSKPNSVPPKAQIIEMLLQKPVNEDTDFSIEIDFSSFVDIVCDQDVIDMDPHWKPQRDVILPDQINYDYIGRHEKFELDFSFIMKQLSIDHTTVPEFSNNRTNSRLKMDRYYTKSIKKRVFQKFELDFQEFDYKETTETLYSLS